MTEDDAPRRTGRHLDPAAPDSADPVEVAGSHEAPEAGADPDGSAAGAPGQAVKNWWAAHDSTGTRVLVAVLALVLIICGFAVASRYFKRGEVTGAAAGDCLKGDGIEGKADGAQEVSLQVVDCRSDAAKYKVLGRITNKPESAAKTSSKLCDPYPDTKFIYWEGVPKHNGTILCLTVNKK